MSAAVLSSPGEFPGSVLLRMALAPEVKHVSEVEVPVKRPKKGQPRTKTQQRTQYLALRPPSQWHREANQAVSERHWVELRVHVYSVRSSPLLARACRVALPRVVPFVRCDVM